LGSNEIGMDPIGFLMDSPVMSLLYFMGDAMTTSPEELVDEWLAQGSRNPIDGCDSEKEITVVK